MPAMTAQKARRAVVTRDDQHFGFKGEDARNMGIKLFDMPDFPIEVAVFARAVGVFVVQEEGGRLPGEPAVPRTSSTLPRTSWRYRSPKPP